jgi:threonine synthase
MDVGDPSNFVRILDLYHNSRTEIGRDITGYSYTDEEIKNCIRESKEKYNYIPDPHGATGFMALSEFLKNNPGYNGIFLETAHPAKFSEIVDDALGETISIPEKLAKFGKREKVSLRMSADYPDFKKYLMGL